MANVQHMLKQSGVHTFLNHVGAFMHLIAFDTTREIEGDSPILTANNPAGGHPRKTQVLGSMPDHHCGSRKKATANKATVISKSVHSRATCCKCFLKKHGGSKMRAWSLSLALAFR